MVLLVLLACADTSLPPESPPDRPAPADPTETPATPTSGLTLSRPDIVFNLVAGAGADDTAAISVTGSMDALAGLSVETHYAAAGEAAWLAVELDRSAKPMHPSGAYPGTVTSGWHACRDGAAHCPEHCT